MNNPKHLLDAVHSHKPQSFNAPPAIDGVESLPNEVIGSDANASSFVGNKHHQPATLTGVAYDSAWRVLRFLNRQQMGLCVCLTICSLWIGGGWAGFACLSNPCVFGVCIDDLNSTYSCYCIDGYTGVQCQTNWDECWSSPCMNGATCIDGVAHYNCSCPDGFIGRDCEENLDECLSNPCQNGGVCNDRDNGYVCTCALGFLGIHCETDMAVCETGNGERCHNGGECIEGKGLEFTCKCSPGWEDVYCDKEINECESSPCHNGGVCVDKLASFACACPMGYTGAICEEEVLACADNPCKNNALCLMEEGQPICYCVPDFHGEKCEMQYDECQLGPRCRNGGTCVDGVDTFSCSCPPHLSGIMCECLGVDTDEVDCNYTSPFFTTMPTTAAVTYITTTDDDDASLTEVTATEVDDGAETTTKFLLFSTTMQQTSTAEDSTTLTTDIVPKTTTTTIQETTTVDGAGETTAVFDTTTTTQPETTTTITTTSSLFSTQFNEDTSGTEFRTSDDDTMTTQKAATTFASGGIETASTTDVPATTWGDTAPFTVIPPKETTTRSFFTDYPDTTTKPSTGELITTTDATKSQVDGETVVSTERDINTMTATTETTITTPFLTTMDAESTEYPTIYTTLSEFNFTGSPNCMRTPCQNGGTCIGTSQGMRCVCRFDRSGAFCETLVDIRNAAFGGNSYLSHQIYPSAGETDAPMDDSAIDEILPMHVQLVARTRARDGLILLSVAQGSRGGHYMALFLHNGLLQFQFSCGLQTMLLSELETPVNNGHEFHILAQLDFSRNHSHCNASLRVNETLAMSGDQPTWLYYVPLERHTPQIVQNVWLHVGGAPQMPVGLVNELSQGQGFTGCLYGLRINSMAREVFRGAIDGSDITECGSLVCLSNPCRNGALCVSEKDESTHSVPNEVDSYDSGPRDLWKCKCPTGFLGPTCEQSVCDNNPCQYGGTCVQFPGSGYLCLCPMGKHGHYCEHNIEVAQPSFSGSVNGLSSYVAYAVPLPLEYSVDLSFKIRPTTISQISLLAFLGQTGYHDDKSDHLAISFIQGYIMLTWNLGGGPRRIFTQKPIEMPSSGQSAIEVKIGRIGRQAWLAVTGQPNVTGNSPGSLTRMDVTPMLFLGGHEIANFTTLPHDLPLHSGFQGCIYDVHLKAGLVTVPLQDTRETRGRGVGQCGTRECHRHACQHEGACLQHGSSFTCICQGNWYGPLCAHASNPCDTGNNKCASGSTCVPLVNGYECDCGTDQTGKYCERRIQHLSDVSMSGRRSYLAVGWPEQLRFEYKANHSYIQKRAAHFTHPTAVRFLNNTFMGLPTPEQQTIAQQHPLLVSSPRGIQRPRVQFFSVEFQLRPLSERGLLLYFGSFERNHDQLGMGFVSVSLQGGVVEFRVASSSNYVTVVRSTRMLAIGEWHKIKIVQNGRRLALWVEGSAATALAPSPEILIDQDALIFLGGLPDLSRMPYNAISGFPMPYRGCIRHLIVSGVRVVLNETNILESRNINDCDGTPCGGDSCDSGGQCWLDDTFHPHCKCPRNAKGDRCEHLESCKIVKCKNGGQCMRTGRCSCPIGWTGFYCEIATRKQSSLSFHGNSYLSMPPPSIPMKDKRNGPPATFERPRDHIQVAMNFSTIALDGLLFWTQKGTTKFIGVGVSDGHLKLANHQLMEHMIHLPTGGFVADGGWHSVKMMASRDRLELTLDGRTIFNEKQPANRNNTNEALTSVDLIYIGGFPEDSSVQSHTKKIFEQPFTGCVQDINFGLDANMNLEDLPPSVSGANIGTCDIDDDELF